MAAVSVISTIKSMIITWRAELRKAGRQVRITCVLSIGEIHGGVIKDFPARNEMNARRPSRILLFVNERGDNEIALPASEGGDGTEGSEEQFAGGIPLFERIAK